MSMGGRTLNQESIVSFQQVTKKIGGKTIVDRLTMEIPRGEVFGFLGPNGAGKTTTIRMMVGLIRITEGNILINGTSIRDDFEEAIKHVGAIVENPEMYKFLTGYQNLVHFARMLPGVTKQRIDEVIELVGLSNRIHGKVKTYSLGMRQRLGVAQALLHRPSLLILDEPTNGLDPAGIRELRDYLRKLAQDEGITVFVSSHLLSEMELMCDRVAIIQNGQLIDIKKVKEDQGVGEKLVPVWIEVDAPDQALAVVQAAFGDAWEIKDGGISAELSREQIPAVNAALVHGGIAVYGIRAVTKSLEDQFLEITGAGQIV